MSFPIPDAALAQHMAILGKTGSGKTSTSKLVVERVVAQDFRVCILDSIKSDWWGITSSADGRAPGLPFRILGGPRGHVPLHASAGAAIGEIVGSGKLPLSILDMADFEMGGLQRFFIDFAPALMRSARGVVYLVLEEAHEFAPKERSGVGGESMATHWAKKLATAGRSKGIRLIVATQRVQALHNAVLGSCETVIAHRLSTPADQRPVVEWLGGHLGKEQQAEVKASLAALPTGTAWVCSGEAKVFEKIAFPKFSTFDNTVTPDRDGAEQKVTTAAVDQAELRAIVGDAVKEAEENDPKALKEEIARLRAATKDAQNIPQSIQGDLDARLKEAHADGRRQGDAEGYERGRAEGIDVGWKTAAGTVRTALAAVLDGQPPRAAGAPIEQDQHPMRVAASPSGRTQDVVVGTTPPRRETVVATPRRREVVAAPAPGEREAKPAREPAGGLTPAQQRILDAIAWSEDFGTPAPTRTIVAFLADTSPKSSTFEKYVSMLRSAGFILFPKEGALGLTEGGRKAARHETTAPTHADIMERISRKLTPAQVRILTAAAKVHPRALTREALAEASGHSVSSSTFEKYVSQLRSLEVLTFPERGRVRADDRLFPEIGS